MRIVFVGAEEVAVRAAEFLIGKGHEVVIIDTDREKIDELSERMDCSFLHGDGSSPSILREVSPEKTDVLISVSNSDPTNLIASLVGRSIGFKRVISSIQNPDYEEICRELGLTNTIMPARTISQYLADMVEGIDTLELSRVIKDAARFFNFIAQGEDAGKLSELDLPDTARVICFYREGRFHLAREDSKLREGDEVLILTDNETLKDLEERWEPENSLKAPSDQ
jgi:trk system potassium uptake protein TrkA